MRALLPVCLFASLIGIAASASTGCGGVALPAGAETDPSGGSIPGAPASSCTMDGTYWVVPEAECGFLNGCPTANAYALCTGTAYTACTCTEPDGSSGWTKAGPPPDAGVDGGFFDVIQGVDNNVPPKDAPPPVDTGSDTGVDTGTDTGVIMDGSHAG
jgi:hypothetical protein